MKTNEIVEEISEILDKYDCELIMDSDGPFIISGYSKVKYDAVKYYEENHIVYGLNSFSNKDLRKIVVKSYVAGYVKARDE